MNQGRPETLEISYPHHQDNQDILTGMDDVLKNIVVKNNDSIISAQKIDTIKNNCRIKIGHTNQFKHILLLSIPGSGNTWTRQLIETSTGYATGSIFPDSKPKGWEVT